MVPTVNRDSLIETLRSLSAFAFVVVVAEFLDERMAGIVRNLYGRSYQVREGGAWGHANRNWMLDQITTSHVWSIDDDDIATPEAWDALHRHLDDPWTIFRMRYGHNAQVPGLVRWREKQIGPGELGTPTIFGPVCSARWGTSYDGDLTYAVHMQYLLGEPVWAEEIVAVIKP